MKNFKSEETMRYCVSNSVADVNQDVVDNGYYKREPTDIVIYNKNI